MKKIILSLLVVLGVSYAGTAQTYSYGLKAGVNQSMGGVITGRNSGVGNWDETIGGTGKIGFQFGGYGQIDLGKFFVRPEIVYTSIQRQWDFPFRPAIHSVQKLDIPLLAGYNLYGPLDVYAGPVYSSIMNSTVEGVEDLDQVVVQNSPINFQVGVKAEFGRFGLDLRYEHSLSTQESQRLDFIESDYGVNLADYEDSAINLIKLSVTFKIGGSGMGNRGYCY